MYAIFVKKGSRRLDKNIRTVALALALGEDTVYGRGSDIDTIAYLGSKLLDVGAVQISGNI